MNTSEKGDKLPEKYRPGTYRRPRQPLLAPDQRRNEMFIGYTFSFKNEEEFTRYNGIIERAGGLGKWDVNQSSVFFTHKDVSEDTTCDNIDLAILSIEITRLSITAKDVHDEIRRERQRLIRNHGVPKQALSLMVSAGVGMASAALNTMISTRSNSTKASGRSSVN